MNRLLLRLTPLVLFIGISIFLFIGLGNDPKKLPSALLDKHIPEFSLNGLQKNSPVFTQNTLKGDISLLNVWATWCFACRDDHQFLMELAETGFPIYGLDYKDNKRGAIAWLDAYGNPYKAVGFDKKGKVAINLGVYGTPETFLIDKHGVIRYRHVGILNKRAWQDKFLPIIKQLTKS
jgi:cytochrome c biogenesis protein CcmG, thiol:disulfide interchange protein DsbE